VNIEKAIYIAFSYWPQIAFVVACLGLWWLVP